MTAPPRPTLCLPGTDLPGMACVAFDGKPGTLAAARHWTAEYLDQAAVTEAGSAVDAMLVVGELMANAVRHAPGPCWLYLAAVPEGLHGIFD